jgi:spoIIIJ-associated protein
VSGTDEGQQETQEQRPDDISAVGGGESLGEAKWAAMKELETRFPGLTAEAVRFAVVEEPSGESGMARVEAEVDVEAWREQADDLPDEPAERVRAVVGRVAQALGLRASVDIEETAEEVRATVNGDDLGLLIGKHGATIDAVQHLAFRAAFRGEGERKQVVVDAAGYRDRRETALHRMADRAVSEALRFDRAVELEPMRPGERKVVHLYLRDRTDVDTHSEGDEPERRLVVTPVAHSEPG